MRIRHAALVFSTSFLLFAAGCSEDATSEAPQKPMTETQTIATRPLCVGRFLIDVPAETRVTWTDTRTALAGVIKREGTLSEKVFATRMRREQERVAGPAPEDASLLKEVREVEDGHARILVFRDAPSNDLYFDIKAFSLRKGTLFSLFGQAEDARLSSAIRDIEKGMRMLKPRDIWTIPTEPGFCFDGGFLPGSDGGFEATGVQLEFPAFPNLLIAFSTRANDGPPPEGAQLLTRTDAVLQGVDGSDRPTVLRREGTRSLGERTAQEVMWKWVKSEGVMLSGNLELYASSHRLDAPEISFELALDPPEKKAGANTDEQDALLLWDTIIQSLRLRPGAV
ncbi:MAG: hypothetical protein H6944_11760 [Zoogloeaceae bacterium]|nr:hypothetical protein [Rhodocyclaceae bacterium]MCP5222352.1 hypothetical protein [Zoogloeaceae bacterium]HQU89922.1 T6SS immunity protein Tli4 family protein [Denitromonas sp.]